MVPILLKALYLPWRKLDLVRVSHKEILTGFTRCMSVYKDTPAKLYTFKIISDTMQSIRSEWHQDQQHWAFWAGCVSWQLGAVASLDFASGICSKQEWFQNVNQITPLPYPKPIASHPT